MDIADQPAVVTGGGSGMGAATAHALAAAGARVTVIDQDEAQAQATAEAVGGRATVCDVTDVAAMEEAFAAAADAYGPTRLAVACAGIAPAGRIIGKGGAEPADQLARVMNVNVMGSYHLLRLAAAQMARAEPVNDDGERGVIIMTASIAAWEGQIGQSAYAASKAAVIGMTLPAARELARFGIRVVSIAPGLIGTPMLLNMPETVLDGLRAATVFPKRLGGPDEFANLAVHVVENVLINGETLRLDGALRMAPR